VVDAFKSVDLGVAGPVSIEAGQSQRAGGVRAEPRLLNFSGGGAQDDDGTKKGFDFGWTIVRPDLQSPALASQLVLVSVPAYSDRLTLKVTTGWLDRDHVRRGAWTDLSLEERLDRLLVGTDRLTMEVSLPPDYDAIDNMMLPGTSRLGPAIDEVSLCNEKLHVAAGQPVDIVIPGERLWRSTVVTLGGQRASEIRVLPDMRGIIASFAGVDRPLADPSATVTGQPGGDSAFVAASGGPAEPVAVTLFVWTSQGADSLRDYVLVHPGSDGPNAQSTDVLATGQ
jgi:hypothetical protein